MQEPRLRLKVFYDGWCTLCVRSAALFRRLDWFGRLELVSFRAPGAMEAHGLDAAALERRMHALQPGGATAAGIDALIQIAARLPALWPLWPLLLLCRALGFGQAAYDFVASRRAIVPAGSCAGAGQAPQRCGGRRR